MCTGRAKKAHHEAHEEHEVRGKSLLRKELGKAQFFFRISIFVFWYVREPCDVDISHQL
jgi:hypothetical protein